MDKDDRATRTILIVVCILAIAPLVTAAMIQIGVLELRRVYEVGKARLTLVTKPFKAARFSR
jgi:hypothetical protein